jgi:exosortase
LSSAQQTSSNPHSVPNPNVWLKLLTRSVLRSRVGHRLGSDESLLRLIPMRRSAAVFVLCAGSFLLVYRAVLVKLVHDWATDDNYSHGFLIVPVAVYLVFERRQRLLSAKRRPSLAGMPMVVASLALLVAGTLGAELFLTRISMVVLVLGTVVFLWGWVHARILAFPIAFLLLMIPLPAIVFNQIAFPLQLVASRFGERTLQLLAIPALREGNVIILSNTTLEVAEACSGIRSLVSLLTLGIVLGYFSDSRTWVRTVVALATVPVAIVANGVRVAGSGLAAYRFGPDAAVGFLHTFSGWTMFLLAFALLFGIQHLLTRFVPATTPASAAQAA